MAASGYKEYYIQLFNVRTRAPIDDDTGVCAVLTDGSPAYATCYADDRGTALTNPVTFTNGAIRFFVADTATSLDLSILTASGYSVFAESITESVHRIDVNPELMTQKLVIPYVFNATVTGAVTDTGFDLSASMLVKDIEVDVFTVATGGVLTVGTSTTTTGFCTGVAASVTGFPVTLLEESLVSTSSVWGTFLAVGTGMYVRKKHVRANATSGANIVYQNTTSSSTAGNGYIYLTYDRLPSRG